MSKITFTINGKRYEVAGNFGPEVSLNDYVRSVADLRGTKAMCHEGGCGSCLVSVNAPLPPDHTMRTFAVNSCLVSVLSCHGWEVTTVEGIGNRTMGYHDIQTRLAHFNGTQCGYCTSGFVMNMYSLYMANNKKLTSKQIEDSFASNMCRCTGYRSIADAFKSFATDADQSLLNKVADLEDLDMFKPCGVKCATSCNKKCSKKQEDLNDFEFFTDEKMLTVEHAPNKRWFRAYTLQDVFKTMAEGEYKLIAGNTGQGVYHVTDYPPVVIDIFNVSELKGFTLDVNLILGAGMTITDMMELFLTMSAENEEFFYLKELYERLELVANIPVQNMGTIAGNLFLKYLHNEFTSDLFILFETVGAMMTVAESINKVQRVTLPNFLRMDMKGKVILNILLPPFSRDHVIKTYSIRRRAQNSHSVVNAGFLFKYRENSDILEDITIVYGGISPSFIHASNTEALLLGKDPCTPDVLKAALKSLSQEIVAEDEPTEGSGKYRKALAINLYYKAILSICPDEDLNPTFRSGGEVIKRNLSKGSQSFETDKDIWPLNQPVSKIEALYQCSGEATFANDLPSQTNEVFGAYVTADITPGSEIEGFDPSEALKIPGVIVFYTAKDIPGKNDFTTDLIPFYPEKEEILCEKKVKFFGQPAGILVANTEKTANYASKLVKVKYSKINSEKPIITVKDALNSPYKDKRVKPGTTVEPTETGHDVKHVIYGEMNIGGQYHYHMETQVCVVKPTEDGMEVYSSTQWMGSISTAISRCLKVPENRINVIVRRVGGGFGGKISRSAQIACSAALVSHLLGKTCRFVLPLMMNMKVVGKRMGTYSKYEVGVNEDGEIQYLKNEIYQDTGSSINESIPIMSITSSYSCYEHKRWKVSQNIVITDVASNTSCRAPYSLEGIAMTESIMEKIACKIGKDEIDVRLKNISKKNDIPIVEMIEQIIKDADYHERKKEIQTYNENNRWRKRAIKLLPMNFDILFLSNYSALVSIYRGDGTVVITHASVEMGQGINTKAAQVCAYELGVPLDKVSVIPSTSFTSPNSVSTGASTSSEAIAFAIIKACEILNKRLEPYKKDGKKWEDVVEAAYQAEVDLQASFMVGKKKDNLQVYDLCAVGVLEVEVDILTGNHNVRRVDILEDTGRSLSPKIDIGQIEGAFIMGLGYWSVEKLKFKESTGELLTDRTWTYTIPGIKDIPEDMRIYFRKGSKNKIGVLHSKATGEPATSLGTIFSHAVRDAIRSARVDAGYQDGWVDIENPCTIENIFMAVGHKLEHLTLQ